MTVSETKKRLEEKGRIPPEQREILNALENWAKEFGYKRTILETGDRQVEAVKFYHKSGYKKIPNYGQYAQMENSNCFEKTLL